MLKSVRSGLIRLVDPSGNQDRSTEVSIETLLTDPNVLINLFIEKNYF